MKKISFTEFENKIKVKFQNSKLLEQAFTHRSYINENPKAGLQHNERLEYLGDAVLELVVTEYLFNRFPENPEGDLTAYRAALVNTQTISQAAQDLGVNDYLLLSRGEAKDIGKARHYILANTFEAIIGALYIDQGYGVAKTFIADSLFYRLDEILKKRLWQDAKSHFQEKSQEYTGITPTYTVLKEAGPDHDKHFTIGVYLKSELVATGEGMSKQEAEQEAAHEGLQAKGWQ